MRRWVNAGSTAIALIRKGYGGKPYLDYVHDVADTHPVRGGKGPVVVEANGGKPRASHRAAAEYLWN